MLNRANPEIYDYRFFPSLLPLPPLSFNLFTIAVGKKKRDEGRRRGGPSTFWPGKTTVALNVWYLVSTHLRQCVPLWHWRGRAKWSGGGRGRKNKRGTAVAEATTAAAFAPSPFSTLFALQQARRGEEGRGGRMTRARRNDIFHRARALSTVISTKIRQRLAIVLEYPRARVLRAQILPRFFFPLSLSFSFLFFLSLFLSFAKRMHARYNFYALVCRCRVLFTKCKWRQSVARKSNFEKVRCACLRVYYSGKDAP